MIAILQQMNRGIVSEVAWPEHVEIARRMDHHMLRVKVKNSTQHSKHWKVLELKERYNMDKLAREADGEVVRTWDEYWEYMLIDGHWADYWFIQATAWLLDMDIQIVDTACTVGPGHYTIPGGIDDGDDGGREILYVGLVTQTHYQSILEGREENHINSCNQLRNNETSQKDSKQSNNETSQKDSKQSNKVIQYKSVNKATSEKKEEAVEDKKCQNCGKELKNVLQHLNKSSKCRNSVKGKQQQKALRDRANDKEFKKEKQNEWKTKSMDKLRKEDEDLVKEKQNERKSKSTCHGRRC